MKICLHSDALLLKHISPQCDQFEGKNGHLPGARQSLRGAEMTAWEAGALMTGRKAQSFLPQLHLACQPEGSGFHGFRVYGGQSQVYQQAFTLQAARSEQFLRKRATHWGLLSNQFLRLFLLMVGCYKKKK